MIKVCCDGLYQALFLTLSVFGCLWSWTEGTCLSRQGNKVHSQATQNLFPWI